jgi:hypothetical protein
MYYRKFSKEMIIQEQKAFITLGMQNKQRILKATGEKHQVTYKVKFIRITADFSTEIKKSKKGME